MNYKRGDLSLFLLLTICASLTLLFLIDFTQLSQRIQFFLQQKQQSKLFEQLDHNLTESKESGADIVCHNPSMIEESSHVLQLKERFSKLTMVYRLNCYQHNLFSQSLNERLLMGIANYVDQNELAYYQQHNAVISVPENTSQLVILDSNAFIKSGTPVVKLLLVKRGAEAILISGHFQGIILLEDGAVLKASLAGITQIQGAIIAEYSAKIDPNIELVWNSAIVQIYADYYKRWKLQKRSWHDY